MKPKVYITFSVQEDVKQYISQHCEVRAWQGKEAMTYEDLLEEVADIDGLYTRGIPIDDKLIDHAPHLKVVSNVSVGYNNFDLQAMKNRNVIGTHTPYVLDETVADLTFGLMLASARRISELDQLVKKGDWEASHDGRIYFGLDVHDTTLGIIGMGRIGEKIARRARLGFNMDVMYHNRTRKRDVEQALQVTYSEFEPLLENADFIVLLTPLTDETYQLIGEQEFKLMKETAIFINVSRGQTVDEQALIRALKKKEIYGAGLDVFEQEPINKDNELLTLPNVVTVPHIGSATARTRHAMAKRAADNIISALTGKAPIDQVPYE